MGTLVQDLRYALRMLKKNPGFTAVAVITLALGIGANTAIFSVVYRALLRPLPYQKPDRLLILAESRSQMDTGAANASYPDYLDWVSQVRNFESLAGFTGYSVILNGNSSPETVFATRVTSNFFSTLGIKPKLGRDFVLGEDRTNGPKVVILSHKFWDGRFGGNRQEMGQTICLDGEPYVVIGVLPKEFEFAPTNSPPLWVPLSPSAGLASRRNLRWMHVIGRLKQAVTFSQAFAEMSAINARLASAYPQENKTIHVVMQPLRERIVGHIRPLLLTLLGAVTFVLLIACANVAHLLLARGAVRKREIAIRIALGAGRREVLRQLLTESVLLALVGGALGLLLSKWGVSLMLTAMPKSQLQTMLYLSSVSVEPAVLAFTLVVAIVTGVLFGLAPALQMSRTNVNENLKDQSRGSAGSVTSLLRDTLVVAEIGLALMLLVGAGLMLRSVRSLIHADPGFRAEKLLTFAIGLLPTTYKDGPAALQFEQRFSERVGNLPGVEGIAAVSKLPLTGSGNTIRFVVEGRPTAQGTEVESPIRTIKLNYFDVMKIALAHGRFFAPTDKIDTPRKLIVNQAFAKQYFPGEDPVGKRIRFTFSPKNPFLEIVGVVGNENADKLDTPMSPIIYTSFQQSPNGYFNCVVRTSGRPEDMSGPIRGALHDLDAELPLIDPQTMEQVIAQSPAVFLRRYPSYLIGSFAGLAVVLAMVGLYGLIAFSVAQRTQEIGIRMALGAQSRDVLRLVMRHGMRLAVAGVACGVVGALIVMQLIRSLLFGVSAADPVTFAAVAASLGAVAIFASYVPARRTSRVDPMVALRYE